MLCGYIYVSISGCGVTELECPCSLQWKRNLVSLYRHTNDALYRYIYWLQIMFNARKPFSTAEKIQKIKIPFLFLIDFGILFLLLGCFTIKNSIRSYFECVQRHLCKLAWHICKMKKNVYRFVLVYLKDAILVFSVLLCK